jgi:triacylglycerol esterase/lipase EstA (alpha/beta hydrolase family)
MINLANRTGEQTSSNNFVDILWNGTAKKLKSRIDFREAVTLVLFGSKNLTYIQAPTAEGDATKNAN